MTQWSPATQARPVEWLMRQNDSQPPYAAIRRFLFGDPNRPDEWYRVVTWAKDSSDRQIIGWCRTLDAAASVAWDYKCAFESWRHHMASRRVEAGRMAAEQPSPTDLVRFYRASLKRAPTS